MTRFGATLPAAYAPPSMITSDWWARNMPSGLTAVRSFNDGRVARVGRLQLVQVAS